MAGIPANPNVSPNVWTPDTYIYISTQPVSTGSKQPKNYFLLAPYLNSAAAMTGAPYSLTAGTAQAGSVDAPEGVLDAVDEGHRDLLPVQVGHLEVVVDRDLGVGLAGVGADLLDDDAGVRADDREETGVGVLGQRDDAHAVDPAGLPAGTYTDVITLDSNDPLNPRITVPVTIGVSLGSRIPT